MKLDQIFKHDNVQVHSDESRYYVNEGTRRPEDVQRDFLKYNKYPMMIRIYYIFYAIYMVVGVVRLILSLVYLDRDLLPHRLSTGAVLIVSALVVWVASTAFEYWNFHNRKMWSLRLVLAGMLEIVALGLVWWCFNPVIALTSMIPINKEITVGMVVALARGILVLIAVLPPVIAGYAMFRAMDQEDSREEILSFKILRGKDLRKDKEFQYDFNAVIRMEDGEPQTVREADRQLHMVVSGATGTAKTSSVLIPAIAADLDKKRHNENFQKECCLKALKQGAFRIKRRFTDQEFSVNYFEPVEGEFIGSRDAAEYFNYLKYNCASAGITVVAPNESLADDVYKLAKNRGFKVNRIDPILVNEEQKEDFIGINPLFISPSITGIEREVAITNNAGVFADVLTALYNMSGSTDAYFASVNDSITIAVCKLLMLTYEDIHGRQPNPADVQICINDFKLCKPYLDKLVEKYGQRPVYDPNNKNDLFVQGNRQVDCGTWQDVYTLITNDLLSADMGPKMYDRANGLRLQINKFMNHPLVRRVLCAKKTIDIDMALENGEITVVNYALELGQSVSTAFGLFYLLTFSKAVLRRPGTEKTRVIHFNYIDEFPVLLHPYLEEYFSLHRQYRVCNTVALQTYDQMDKNRATQFLKSVLQGVGHQIMFGRMSVSEMETFKAMAGTEKKNEEQFSETETSITSENPMHTFSRRTSMKEVDYVSPTSMRYRDFQEVTFFTTEQGTPLRPLHGKVNFLKSSMWKGLPAVRINWTPYMQGLREERNDRANVDLYVERVEDLPRIVLSSGYHNENRG